jgi:hypothetical protein
MNDIILYEFQKKIEELQNAMIELKKKNTEFNTTNVSNVYNLQNDVLTIQNALICINNEINQLQPPYKSWCTYICNHMGTIASFLFMYIAIIYILIRIA